MAKRRKPAIDFGRDEEISEFTRQYRRVHPLTEPDFKVTRARRMKADNEYGRTVRRKQAEGYVIFEDDSMLHKSKFPKTKRRGPRAEFPNPMVEGQKRYPAYNVQPIRPRKRKRDK